MSLFVVAVSTCGTCGHTETLRLAASVNADSRPDLRTAIMDGTFQALTCEACQGVLRLPPHLSYVDMGRGQWLLTENVQRLADWRMVEAGAQAIFDQTYGPAASPVARELGGSLCPRLVFGWPALREKLLCRALRLNDVTLELLKLAMLRAIPDPPCADTHELRLVGGDPESLHMMWIEGASEEELGGTDLERAAYDAIEADPEEWAALRAGIAAGLFVDCRRLFLA